MDVMSILVATKGLDEVPQFDEIQLNLNARNALMLLERKHDSCTTSTMSWSAAFPAPKSTPQEITAQELAALKDGEYIVLDVRRTDIDVSAGSRGLLTTGQQGGPPCFYQPPCAYHLPNNQECSQGSERVSSGPPWLLVLDDLR